MSLTQPNTNHGRLRAVALACLGAIVLGCGGSKPVTEAPAESPAQAAARVFAAAEELERQDKTRQAFAAYHQILQKYPDTPEGKKAAERIRRARQQSKTKLKARAQGKVSP